MTKFLLVFAALSLCNVIFSTVKSIVTIKGGALSSALISGAYYTFYNVVLVMTVADFSMFWKCVVTLVANIIGVYLVKRIEEKMRKDKLWKIEVTIPKEFTAELDKVLADKDIPHNYIPNIGKYAIFNCYCATQVESKALKSILAKYNAKYFVSESQSLY